MITNIYQQNIYLRHCFTTIRPLRPAKECLTTRIFALSIVYIGATLSPFSLAVSWIGVLGEGNIEIMPLRDLRRVVLSSDMDNFMKHKHFIFTVRMTGTWKFNSFCVLAEDSAGKFDRVFGSKSHEQLFLGTCLHL